MSVAQKEWKTVAKLVVPWAAPMVEPKGTRWALKWAAHWEWKTA